MYTFCTPFLDFRLDASSETLLIEGDPDLQYLKEVTERYGSKDFLVLTYTPNEGMISDSSIYNLLSLKYKIQSLDWVHSVRGELEAQRRWGHDLG